jgi:cytochrome c5
MRRSRVGGAFTATGTADVIAQSVAAAASLGATAPDPAALGALLATRSRDAATAAAAVDYARACAAWHSSNRYGAPAVALFKPEWKRARNALMRSLRRRERQGSSSERQFRRQQATRIIVALATAGWHVQIPSRRIEALRECGMLALGLVHHLASGTPLPASCSSAEEWT